jgi:hypothetical protein
VNQWGSATYGDPCRECGFSWSTDAEAAQRIIRDMPSRVGTAIAGARGDEQLPGLGWSVSGYVLHVGDNLRIWAERLAGIALGGSNVVASFDEDALAAARDYPGIGPAAAQWSLQRATGDWLAAVQLSAPDVVMIHPQRGTIDLTDIAQTNAHDGVHHLWDIERTLAG